MAWDEWEQIKREATRRGDGQMRLDQLPADAGSGPSTSGVTGGLVSNKQVWNKAAGDIGGLRTAVGEALKQLQDGQKDLGDDAGCLTAGAQKEVHESWARYIKGLDGRCGSIDEILQQVGHDLLLTDDAVRAAFDAVDTRLADTSGLGGQGAGR